MTSQYLRLKDNHPTMQKVMKLFELAEELGISLSFYSHRVVVEDSDRDRNLPPLYLEDIEDSHVMSMFPPATEFKIIYDNPKYLEERELEAKAYRAKKEEEARLKKERRLQEEQEALKRRVFQIEKEEKDLLKKLKDKYEH